MARSVGPPSPSSPRVTSAKAHSAREDPAGSGRGNHARRRWSRHVLSNDVVTRTRRSPAWSSSVVVTTTSRSPVRAPATTRSGHR